MTSETIPRSAPMAATDLSTPLRATPTAVKTTSAGTASPTKQSSCVR
jgi:hypothetical protein